MVDPIYLKSVLHHTVVSVVSTIVLAVLLTVVYWLTRHKFVSSKSRSRYAHRILFLGIIIFLLVMTHIWVEGFTHLFTMLSLVAAGLVVVNKETVMNFVGSLIISWRGLFNEGDLIQIQSYYGYVNKLGPLYFSLYETRSSASVNATGRTIRIPNSLVITTPLVNYSSSSNLIQYQLDVIVTAESNLEKAEVLVSSTLNAILKKHYHNNSAYNLDAIKRNNRWLAEMMSLEVSTSASPRQEKPFGILIRASYYCFPKDQPVIERAFWSAFFKKLKSVKSIKLSYSN